MTMPNGGISFKIGDIVVETDGYKLSDNSYLEEECLSVTSCCKDYRDFKDGYAICRSCGKFVGVFTQFVN